MDIILELTDTFIADHAYAFFFPKRPAPYDYPNANNATAQVFSSWTYKPATAFFSIEPYPAAYQSEFDRDNAIRQVVTLFFITWCASLRFDTSLTTTNMLTLGSLDWLCTSLSPLFPTSSSSTSAL